ncbi:hypothetical protein SBY92_003015 [Candida maltosa Xu316]
MSEGNNTFMHLVRPNVIAPGAGSANGPANIKIQSPAMLTILEIISQQVLNKRVIGTLLGSRSDDGLELEIKEAFMVPLNETGDSIAIEDQIHKSLYQLYKKAHPRESVLGWFGSLNKIDDVTSLIHDFYSKGADRAYPYPAIYLNVEFLNEENQIISPKVTTYIGAAVGKPVSQVQQIGWKSNIPNNSYIFTPIPNEIVNGTINEKKGELSNLSDNLTLVNENIEKLLAHIEKQGSGNDDDDVELLRLLSNSLLNKPSILNNLEELERLFKNHNQDVIMIEYLTKAVKDQIELSARLTISTEMEKKN